MKGRVEKSKIVPVNVNRERFLRRGSQRRARRLESERLMAFEKSFLSKHSAFAGTLCRARGAVLGLAWGETRGSGLGHATLQGLALAGACLDRPPWSLGAWVCWLLTGQRAGIWTHRDPFLEKALTRLRRGEPPERTGYPTPRLGPSARVGPIGVLFRADPASLLRVSIESTLVTHADLRAAVFAFAVAYAVARLVEGKHGDEVIAVLPDVVRGVEDSWTLPRHCLWERDHGAPHVVSEALREVFSAYPPGSRRGIQAESLRSRVCLAARPHLTRGEAIKPNGAFVLCGGLHGLAAALLSESPEHVLEEISKQGGEAELVGAIAGTVLGAKHGDEWIGSVPGRVVRWADALAAGSGAETRDEFAGLGPS